MKNHDNTAATKTLSQKQKHRKAFGRATLITGAFWLCIIAGNMITNRIYRSSSENSREIPISSPRALHSSGSSSSSTYRSSVLAAFEISSLSEESSSAITVPCSGVQHTPNKSHVVQQQIEAKNNGQVTVYSITETNGYPYRALSVYEPLDSVHTCIWSENSRYFRVTGTKSASMYGGSNYELTTTEPFDYIYDVRNRQVFDLNKDPNQ